MVSSTLSNIILEVLTSTIQKEDELHEMSFKRNQNNPLPKSYIIVTTIFMYVKKNLSEVPVFLKTCLVMGK